MISCGQVDSIYVEKNSENELIKLEEVCRNISSDKAVLVQELSKKYKLIFRRDAFDDNVPEITRSFVNVLLGSVIIESSDVIRNSQNVNVLSNDNSGTCVVFFDAHNDLNLPCAIYIAIYYENEIANNGNKNLLEVGIREIGVHDFDPKMGYKLFFQSSSSSVRIISDDTVACDIHGSLMCKAKVGEYQMTIELKKINDGMTVRPFREYQMDDEDDFWNKVDEEWEIRNPPIN